MALDQNKGVWKSAKGKGRRTPKGRQFEDEALSEIKSLLANRPKHKDLLIEFLHLIQDKYGYLSAQHLCALAEELKLSMAEVYEVASFYSMIETEHVGKHTISVCTNVSCMLNGSDEILQYIENKLKIKVGESSEKYFLKDERECLAACCGAPMMQVDHKYYENLTKEKIDLITEGLENEK